MDEGEGFEGLGLLLFWGAILAGVATLIGWVAHQAYILLTAGFLHLAGALDRMLDVVSRLFVPLR